MSVFKTLDIRGQSFFDAFHLTNQAVNDVKSNGMLELILDKKRNFLEAFRSWASSKGYDISGVNEDQDLIRVFIKKVAQIKKR